MTPEEITRAALVANSSLNAIVGDNVFIERVPQGFKNYPCILINFITENPNRGQIADCVDEVKLQVSAITTTYTQLSTIGQLIRAEMDRKKGVFGTTTLIGCIYESSGVEPDFDDGKFYTKSLDFNFLIQK
jgi:hypothetical protein